MKHRSRNPVGDVATLPLLAAGAAASAVLVGLGGYLVYRGLNPPDTTTTLEDSAALATLASVAL